ncbi:hypothetical protein EVAR_59723_1 [Eumeta japonica]|uniref:Uncharacterized protein n=1 Tax=Eumeta variegata TaxID=151549 RepID=A0A4C1XKW3_EUMVA|nr:hypothetical protein EVAR_59723_1 [Eumeta japonica]
MWRSVVSAYPSGKEELTNSYFNAFHEKVWGVFDEAQTMPVERTQHADIYYYDSYDQTSSSVYIPNTHYGRKAWPHTAAPSNTIICFNDIVNLRTYEDLMREPIGVRGSENSGQLTIPITVPNYKNASIERRRGNAGRGRTSDDISRRHSTEAAIKWAIIRFQATTTRGRPRNFESCITCGD